MANITTTPEEIARARLCAVEKKAQRRMRKGAAKQKPKRRPGKSPKGSVRTVSGGLPGLGKRR
ncbi:MAG: hypothetical protein AB7O60_03685 [Variibacter sp.]